MILQEGGLPALLSILTNGDEEAACRVAAVRARPTFHHLWQLSSAYLRSVNLTRLRHSQGAIANLAMDEANQEALVASNTVQALVRLARCAKQDAGRGRQRPPLHMETKPLAPLPTVYPYHLVPALTSPLPRPRRTGRDPQTLRMVAGALANLCGNPAVEEALFESGAVELLVEMSTSPNADVLAQVARGLGNCARSPAGRTYLLDIGAFQGLWQSVVSDRPSGMHASAGCLFG